ncbi:MAG TPA: GDYXXLXY domain-containing protein [Bacillota bacterium]|nr:GDYXXLXY domain-containing protein [Bacillota bacterium]HPT87783.1 GDYXXLXY domain-containing protein [Bacillota bacterium]
MGRKTIGFASAVLLQLLILLIIVIPRWSIIMQGRTIILETLPYDPYHIFRGYYMDLRYRIAVPENLPGNTEFKPGRDYYVILAPDETGIWQPAAVADSLPQTLKPNEAVIRGRYRYGQLDFSINQYYLPENRRLQVEKLLRDSQQPALVEVKVKNNGTAAIFQIIIEGQRFRY